MRQKLKNKIIILTLGVLFVLLATISINNPINKDTQSMESDQLNEDLTSLKSSSTPLWRYTTSGWVRSVAISSDGNYIAAGGVDKKVYLFNKSSSMPLWNYTTGGNIYSVSISSNCTYIAAGSRDYNVYLFHKSSSTPLWSYNAGHYIFSVSISSDGNYIVAGGGYSKVYLFHKSSSTPLWSSADLDVRDVAISSDGNYIAVGGGLDTVSGGVYLFHKSSSTPLWSYATVDSVSSVSISSNGTYIAAGSRDNNTYLFEKSSSTPLWSYMVGGESKYIQSVAISSDGNYIVAGDWDTKIYLFEKSSSIPLWTKSMNLYQPPVMISSNGSYLVVGGIDGVYLFHKSSSTPLWSYTTSGSVMSVAITPDGNYIAAGGGDKKVYLFSKTQPDPFILSSDADNPDPDGMLNLNWEASVGADNYSIYSHNSYITYINESVIELANGFIEFTYPISGLSSDDYYFVVVAYNESGYTHSNCIYVSVRIPPGPFTLSSDADNLDTDGTFNLNWGASAGADNYSIYVHGSYITGINGSVTELANGIMALTYPISGLSSGDYYYIIVAYNETGNTISNCIKAIVQIPSKKAPSGISGYNIWFLIGAICVVSAILVKKLFK